MNLPKDHEDYEKIMERIAAAEKRGLLNLSFMGLAFIPAEVKKLTGLTHLNVSVNELTELPEWLGQLTGLTQLNVGGNGLMELPEWLGQLTGLTELYVSRNNLTELPEWLGQLTGLTELYVSRNNLMELPEGMEELPNLTQLDVSYNNLTKLPAELLDLPNLNSLYSNNNPWQTPPPEVFGIGDRSYQKADLPALRDYFAQIRAQGSAKLYEAKILILGEGGAGKTTLAKKLLDATYALDKDEIRTEGIEIYPYQFKIMDNQDFRANLWDFGGQEIYHATHQYFLSHRSLYLLVTDERKYDTDFNYWLNVVEMLGGESPLLIIKNDKQNYERNINENGIRGRFVNVKEFIPVNLATNAGLPETHRLIQQYLQHLPLVGTPWPQTWANIRATLENDPHDYISLGSYFSVCAAEGIVDTAEALRLSGILHDLGVILYFQTDEVLKNTVILKPEWGTSAVYAVLDHKTIKSQNGHFTKKDVESIWTEARYINKHPELLRLMLKFGQCYQVAGQDVYIAPELLPSNQPENLDWADQNNLVQKFTYEFMPKGILSQFVVATNDLIADQDLVWKEGVKLAWESAQALVRETYGKKEIEIRISGRDRKSFMQLLNREFKKIHNSYHNIQTTQWVPCNCDACENGTTPYLYRLDSLKNYLVNYRDKITCEQSFTDVEVHLLVDDFDERLSGKSDEERVRKIKQKDAVFISYGWGGKSEKMVDQVDQAMQASGLEVIRDKRDLGYKDRIQNFMRDLGKGSAVVVILSDKYLHSENCMFELTEIAKNKNFYQRVFPIIMPDANIFKTIERMKLVKYWQDQIAEINATAKELDLENIEDFLPEYEIYQEIGKNFGKLTTFLKDLNTLTPQIHIDEDFKTLIAEIKKTLK